jgi:hypothetical protein
MLISKPKSYNNWSTDLDNAAKYVAQITSSLDITHHISSIENTQDGILAMFDQFSGIDWIGKTPENNLYGVAVRVQWVNDSKAWNSLLFDLNVIPAPKPNMKSVFNLLKKDFSILCLLFKHILIESLIK